MRKTIDAQEIHHFQKDSDHWWDESGPFAPLHKLNPVRMKFLRDTLCSHLELNPDNLTPLKNISVIDIGCGGGLVTEPMARMGANVTGIDADEKAIAVARAHAMAGGLITEAGAGQRQSLTTTPSPVNLDYQAASVEEMTQQDRQWDVVLALEIIEHVTERDLFIEQCSRLVKPGGLIILSTLNRTPQSFLKGIVAAEYLLRWVPAGTHNWRKFMRPSELSGLCARHGIRPVTLKGMEFKPFSQEFVLSDDITTNYFLAGVKE